MAEQTANTSYEALAFGRYAKTLKLHGILSIVFGAIGAFVGILIAGVLTASLIAGTSLDMDDFGVMEALMMFILWTIPHIYLVIAGLYLIRQPKPAVAKGLIITNLVVGACVNLVIFIFAIINLAQFSDYARHYERTK